MKIYFTAFCIILLSGISCHSGISLSYENAAGEAVDVMVPLIEKICDEEFSYVPDVVASNVIEVGEIIKEENEVLMNNLSGFLTSTEKKLFNKTAGLKAVSLLAKYSPGRKKIYIIPDNITASISSEGYGLVREKEAFTMLLGHELVHALQDQRYRIFRLVDDVRSVDEDSTLNACIEGHAVFVMEKVMKEYGAGKLAGDLVKRNLESIAVSAPVDMFVKTAVEQMNFYYVKGAQFFEFVYDTSGAEGVKEVLKSPPRYSDIILHPERLYRPVKRKRILEDRVLSGIGAQQGLKGWRYTKKRPGEAMLRSTLLGNGFDPEKLDRILERYIDAVSAVWYKDDRQFVINIFTFKNSRWAREYVEADRDNFRRMVADEVISLRSSEKLELPGVERCWQDDFDVMVFLNKLEFYTAGFQKDFIVVDIQCINAPEMAVYRKKALNTIIDNITGRK